MIFSWNDPHTLHTRKSPKKYAEPKHSFSLLVPVREEAEVIGDTIKAMTLIDYPEHLLEIFILCRIDDGDTIEAIKKAARKLKIKNINLLFVGTEVDNKPKSLNIGLSRTSNDIVAVFDAEDEPHPEILHIINTLLVEKDYDVVQSGVQLISHDSNWFSAYNVLEYYFWFKSSLHMFTQLGVVPLGGNTVFIKRETLLKVNGWNEEMLTEDADLGIRLSLENAKIGVVYDEQHVTKEETPCTITEFVKQRTRWNQGFLQIFFQFKWLQLHGLRRKMFTAYLLCMPLIQALWIIYFPITLFANFFVDLPVTVALFSVIPGYVLLLQLLLYNYGLYEFTRDYNFKYSPIYIAKLLITFFPYQLLLGLGAGRAVGRLFAGNMMWEKTAHLNAHRGLENAA